MRRKIERRWISQSNLELDLLLVVIGLCILATTQQSLLTWNLYCMISENANGMTIDTTDFYLGTPLPHPEYIRIPR
jgi:hypothetical protein